MTRANPATDADRAVAQIDAAHAAFTLAVAASPAQRGTWLHAIADALDAAADELVDIAVRETHLSKARLDGELARTTFQLRLFIDELIRGENLDVTIDHADEDWGMGPRPDIRRVNVPLGVVGVFGASNFPFAFSVIGGDSASALAAGCAVVHKIHDGHRELALRTSEVVTAALARAEAPAGLFSVVTGRTAANVIVDHPRVKAIGFTGSTIGGRALLDRVALRAEPIPFYGELGSINPVVVTERAWAARSDIILEQFVASFTAGMGQFCTKPGVLFAPTSDVDALRASLTRHLAKQTLTPLLTPVLRHGFAAALAQVAALPGVDVLITGDDGPTPTPTVLLTTATAVRLTPDLLSHEIFGPATVIVQYPPRTDLAGLVGLMGGQLTATVHAEPREELSDLVATLTALSGRVVWNGWPTGVTVTYAQNHGGPYPATTASRTTSVGTAAAARFMRPAAHQSFPAEQLPPALQDTNPWGVIRRINGRVEIPATILEDAR
jgi:NADP-dependent aldehyde dehydrogenase